MTKLHWVLFLLSFECPALSSGEEKDIPAFLREYNRRGTELQHDDTLAAWNFETDMTDENKAKTVSMSAKTSEFSTEARKTARKLLASSGGDVDIDDKRQLKLITRTTSSINEEDNKRITKLTSTMTDIYSKTAISKKLDGEDFKFKLNSHLLPIMSDVSVENANNLQWAWTVWRKAVGPKVKPLYEEFVKLANKGAKENGFKNYGDFWKQEYEVDDIEEMSEGILREMLPLYRKLHAYTRFKLNKLLGDEVVSKDGPMPAHLLGMWAQNWAHLYSNLCPFPSRKIPDVTKRMKELDWSKKRILKEAESFFVSIGLEPMPQSFYENSLFHKPDNKKVVCHPSSWDLGSGDVRMKMPCMGVTHEDMITVHHEMGHVEYYLLYKDQPLEFRTGANPGFHEAIGDTIALSVMVPNHLQSIGLMNSTSGDKEEGINFLMKQALQKISFIPFAYIVDKWRWAVFAGDVPPDQYNDYWLKLGLHHQGVRPPIRRTSKDLFDPGTFFHVAHNTEYLRYFLSHILQFQFHKALCDEADHEGPYHRCSIHKNTKAGKKLRLMLELGRKKPWPEALEVLCKVRKLSAKPILDYFEPLVQWLDDHRSENGYSLGWNDGDSKDNTD